MPNTLNQGLPYPAPTDPVDVPGDIQALAEAIDTKMLDKAVVNAKGDLIVGLLDNTIDNLAVGSNGTTLLADSTETLGVKWGQVSTEGIANSAVTTAKIADSNVTTAKIADANVTAAKLASGVGIPTGVVNPYAGSTSPDGWLLCDGTAVSRTTYSALFAVIGTTYGSGNGSTTFNLPDMKGRVPVGRNPSDTDATSLNFSTLAATRGAKTHTLSSTEMPYHNHSGTTDNALTDGSMTVAGGAGTSALGDHVTGFGSSPTATLPDNSINLPGGNHDHAFTTTYAGGSGGATQAHNNIQPSIVLNYIIKT